MAIITLSQLKEQLELHGVTYDLDDSELALLLHNTITQLIGYTNLPILPRSYKQIDPHFEGKTIELDYYPVSDIVLIQIGSKQIGDNDYILDDDHAILYLHTPMSGILVVEYIVQIPDRLYHSVNSLIFDLIKLNLKNNFEDTAFSSVKEGDVTVQYDNSNSLPSLIQQRIVELKNMNSCKIRMLWWWFSLLTNN